MRTPHGRKTRKTSIGESQKTAMVPTIIYVYRGGWFFRLRDEGPRVGAYNPRREVKNSLSGETI
jgi:hypothetical protein